MEPDRRAGKAGGDRADSTHATAECCRANVPPLDFTRPDGAEWECPKCGGRWIWDVDEAEGGAWCWDPENDRE